MDYRYYNRFAITSIYIIRISWMLLMLGCCIFCQKLFCCYKTIWKVICLTCDLPNMHILHNDHLSLSYWYPSLLIHCFVLQCCIAIQVVSATASTKTLPIGLCYDCNAMDPMIQATSCCTLYILLLCFIANAVLFGWQAILRKFLTEAVTK